jgi:hypothetical protein
LVGGAFPVHADNATGAPSNSSNLARLWTTVFQTPSDQNPFGTGDAQSACISLAKQTIAPFAPAGVTSCSVAAGTSIFVTASSVECSTFEGNGNTKAELRSCAIAGDAQTAPTVTVDGAPVTVGGTESGLMRIVLPTNNIFGLPSGTRGRSYAHGWVTLVRPLPPGAHQVVITVGTNAPITTTIQVK